jgi:hypothetical protein
VPFSSSVVRRPLLIRYGAFDTSLAMGIDWDLWLRLSCNTDFDYVPRRLVHYRTGHDQMSRNLDGRFAAADAIFDRFLAERPGLLTSSEQRKIELYNACSRAAAYRRSDLRRSTLLLWTAARRAPLASQPYLGLMRNACASIRTLASHYRRLP